MRKKIFACVFLLVLFIFFAENKTTQEMEDEHVVHVKETTSVKAATTEHSGPLGGLRIVLDAGHGGFDSGAVGPTGFLEKDTTLRTVSILKELLEDEGATVFLTRERDEFLSLETRVQLAAYGRAHLFISVHADGYESPEVKGITTYYYDHYSENLAQSIQASIFKEISETENRGIDFGNFQVLRDTFVPAVLIELGYITNPEDEMLLRTDAFQELISQQIVQGIVEYKDGLKMAQRTVTETADDTMEFR